MLSREREQEEEITQITLDSNGLGVGTSVWC